MLAIVKSLGAIVSYGTDHRGNECRQSFWYQRRPRATVRQLHKESANHFWTNRIALLS
jgi:hypothetical protein